VTVDGSFQGEVWWQEVAESVLGGLEATGHRIADITALAGSLEEAIAKAYADIRKIRSLGSYYRTDVGQSLWPPGNA
jgi:phosphoribosylamine-glycine ligase